MVSKPSARVAARQAARAAYREQHVTLPATLFGAPNRAARRDRSAEKVAPAHDRSNRSDAARRADDERSRRIRERRRAAKLARKANRV